MSEREPLTRRELAAMHNWDLRLAIGAILGYDRLPDIDNGPDFHATTGRWAKNGEEVRYLPNWPDSLDACVELWEFAKAKRFRADFRAELECIGEDGTCDQMLHPPALHCRAFVHVAQKEGF